MKYSINLRSYADLSLIQQLPISDIVIQSDEFSRFGGISTNKLPDVIYQLKQQNKKVILAWDCLVKDDEIIQLSKNLTPFISDLDAIRFIDPGIGSFLKTKFPNSNLEFSLEHGSLNQQAILQWGNYFLPQLKKVILSLQLPLADIKKICPKIPVSTEVLAAGPIGIFYTRRSLLSEELTSQEQNAPELTIASDDRPEQKNPILKSSKGTLVFYDKSLNIFDQYDELKDAGIDYLRIEYLHREELKYILELVSKNDWKRAMSLYRKEKSTNAFLQSNPTHKLFGMLKNKHLSEMSDNKSGVVVESVKSRYSLISIDQSISLPQKIKFVTPEGKIVITKLDKLKDLKEKEHTSHAGPGVYLTDWYKFVVTGSIIQFLAEESY